MRTSRIGDSLRRLFVFFAVIVVDGGDAVRCVSCAGRNCQTQTCENSGGLCIASFYAPTWRDQNAWSRAHSVHGCLSGDAINTTIVDHCETTSDEFGGVSDDGASCKFCAHLLDDQKLRLQTKSVQWPKSSATASRTNADLHVRVRRATLRVGDQLQRAILHIHHQPSYDVGREKLCKRHVADRRATQRRRRLHDSAICRRSTHLGRADGRRSAAHRELHLSEGFLQCGNADYDRAKVDAMRRKCARQFCRLQGLSLSSSACVQQIALQLASRRARDCLGHFCFVVDIKSDFGMTDEFTVSGCATFFNHSILADELRPVGCAHFSNEMLHMRACFESNDTQAIEAALRSRVVKSATATSAATRLGGARISIFVAICFLTRK